MNSCALSKLQALVRNPTHKKFALSAASLAAVASTAKGEVVHVTDTVSWVGEDASASWDIDQDSTPDWTFSDGLSGYDGQCFNSSGTGSSGFVRDGTAIVSVDTDTVIGVANTFGHLVSWDGLVECSCGPDSTALAQYTESPSGTFSGYFGYSFTSAASTHYGIAAFTATNWGGYEQDGTFTITEWYYESVAGADFTGISPVPEPATAALGIGVLALGATALRRRRRAVNA